MSNKSYDQTIGALNKTIDFLSIVPYAGFRVYESGEIPSEPVILAINHKLKVLVNPFLRDKDKRTRWIDHLFVGAKYPKKVHFMVQDIQYMKLATKRYLERLETFSSNKIRQGLRYLDNGECVGIFPEGPAHLTEDRRMYWGIAWLSAHSKRKILPVYISKNSKDVNNVLHPKLNSLYIDYLTPLEPPKSCNKEDLEGKVNEFLGVFEGHKRFLYFNKKY
ncbi:MAG: hypothetical protein V1660_04760 [archaeon]